MDIDQMDEVSERPKWDGFWLLFWGVVASIAAWAFGISQESMDF